MKISKVIFHIKLIPSHPWWDYVKGEDFCILCLFKFFSSSVLGILQFAKKEKRNTAITSSAATSGIWGLLMFSFQGSVLLFLPLKHGALNHLRALNPFPLNHRSDLFHVFNPLFYPFKTTTSPFISRVQSAELVLIRKKIKKTVLFKIVFKW